MEVQPARPGAAAVYVTYVGGFRRTHANLWNDRPDDLEEELGLLLYAVFEGRFEEAGRGDRFARAFLRDGTTMRLGAMHLPLPWRFRRRRRYEPLSG